MSSTPLNPFTWSMRRREMFERCPREYFYHYYGSVGGAFVNMGTPEAERLHLLRELADLESYIRRLIFRQLRQLFNGGALEAPGFFTFLEAQFRREFRDMLKGKPERDHKHPLLKELTLPGDPPRILEEKVLKNLEAHKDFLQEHLLPFLLGVPSEMRLCLPFPLKINWSDLVCFTTPAAIWHSAGTFNAFCAGSPSEENSALMSFYAFEKFRTPPEKVQIFHWSENSIIQAAPLASFSAPFRRIRQDVDNMLFLELKLQNTPGGEKLFPREYKHCPFCRFSSVCT